MDEMREKSNFDLQELVSEFPDEDKQRILAALRELDRRGALYSDNRKLLEELEGAESISEPAGRLMIAPVTQFGIFRDPDIVDDVKAPVLYSRFSVRLFAILFSTLFGGILISINLKRLEKRREILFVLGFSLLYSYLVFYASTIYPRNATTITLIMNLVGSLLLEEIFWKRYIGKHFKFRKQSIGGALLIGIGISVLLIYVMLSAS